MSYPVESIIMPDQPEGSEGRVVELRQADIGWEYKTGYSTWRKANNREQALEFARADVASKGKMNLWRETI